MVSNKHDKLNKYLDSKKGYFFLAVLFEIDENEATRFYLAVS